jgi:hypothetical protein
MMSGKRPIVRVGVRRTSGRVRGVAARDHVAGSYPSVPPSVRVMVSAVGVFT